jgi:hypothetical protein
MTNFVKWITKNECHMDDFGDSILNNKYVNGENINIISEAGLSRLLSKYDNGQGTFAIITAYRNEENGKKLTKQDKIKLNRKLRTELNSVKMGVYQLVGHWRECSDPDIEYKECPKNMLVDVIERSYFVPKNKDITDDEFEQFITKLTKKYNQDSSLLYMDGITYLVYKTGKKEPIGKNISLGKISQAYSQHVKKMNTPFVFEGIEQPDSIGGAKVMKNEGIKYFIDLM